MRRASLCLCFSLMAFIPPVAVAQAPIPTRPSIGQARSELTYTREIFAGSESRIAAMNWVNSDCSSDDLPTLRFVTPPQNGDIRTQETTIPIDRPKSNPRAACNGKQAQALAVFYKPKDGYIGPDKVVIDVDFHMGQVRRLNYKITVR